MRAQHAAWMARRMATQMRNVDVEGVSFGIVVCLGSWLGYRTEREERGAYADGGRGSDCELVCRVEFRKL
jgi:ABC-type nickel/cobalt efflux system permease component RcnA